MTSYLIGTLANRIIQRLLAQADLSISAKNFSLIEFRENSSGAHHCAPAAELPASGRLPGDAVTKLMPRVAAEAAVQRRPTPIAGSLPSIKCAGTSGVDGAGPGKTDARGDAPSPGRVPGWK